MDNICKKCNQYEYHCDCRSHINDFIYNLIPNVEWIQYSCGHTYKAHNKNFYRLYINHQKRCDKCNNDLILLLIIKEYNIPKDIINYIRTRLIMQCIKCYRYHDLENIIKCDITCCDIYICKDCLYYSNNTFFQKDKYLCIEHQ